MWLGKDFTFLSQPATVVILKYADEVNDVGKWHQCRQRRDLSTWWVMAVLKGKQFL